MQSPEIRCYILKPDGSLEADFDTELSHYGTCPTVGDVICRWGFEAPMFAEVARRYFVDPHDGTYGWTLVLKPVTASPEMSGVYSEWVASSRFWDEVDRKEANEAAECVRARLQGAPGARPNKPRRAQSTK